MQIQKPHYTFCLSSPCKDCSRRCPECHTAEFGCVEWKVYQDKLTELRAKRAAVNNSEALQYEFAKQRKMSKMYQP